VVGASRGNIEGSGVGGVGIGTLLQVSLVALPVWIVLNILSSASDGNVRTIISLGPISRCLR